jgi:hypothetical protein
MFFSLFSYFKLLFSALMDIVQKDSKAICVARWTIADFSTHVDNKTDGLCSENFEIGGLKAKFYLRGYFNNGLGFHLIVDDMAGEGSIKVKSKFWLEDSNGEKCATTSGKLFII